MPQGLCPSPGSGSLLRSHFLCPGISTLSSKEKIACGPLYARPIVACVQQWLSSPGRMSMFEVTGLKSRASSRFSNEQDIVVILGSWTLDLTQQSCTRKFCVIRTIVGNEASIGGPSGGSLDDFWSESVTHCRAGKQPIQKIRTSILLEHDPARQRRQYLHRSGSLWIRRSPNHLLDGPSRNTRVQILAGSESMRKARSRQVTR